MWYTILLYTSVVENKHVFQKYNRYHCKRRTWKILGIVVIYWFDVSQEKMCEDVWSARPRKRTLISRNGQAIKL